MAYEVIARKWRPKTFDEVVGQEAITQTLRNAVAHERLHHAYLFTGARGVGKTTTARLLAKALNCAKGVTPDPDNTCDSCREITAGNSMDVMEIDAASHTGVDNIRDTIINSVGIAPARDRYKVFIIDEVHQLSQAAFNALLKTLEEPPPRVVFVLATTELHKVPDTITSRCQIFEFRTINLAKVQAKLGEIAAQMGVKATPAALAAIARAGEGSMRDAQSALDQVIAFAGDSVDVPDVSTALGVVGDEVVYDFFDAIAKADAPAVLRLTTRLVAGGHDLRNFARSMMRTARNLLVVRAVGFDAELVDAAEGDAKRVNDLAREFAEAELVRAFAMLSELEQEIRLSSDPRFQLEIGMVRLAELPRLRPLDDIIDRLSKLEAKLTGGGGPGAGGRGPGPGTQGAGGRGPGAGQTSGPGAAGRVPESLSGSLGASAVDPSPITEQSKRQGGAAAPAPSSGRAPTREPHPPSSGPRLPDSALPPEEPPHFDDEPPFDDAPPFEPVAPRKDARPAPGARPPAPLPPIPPPPPARAAAPTAAPAAGAVEVPPGVPTGLDGDAAAEALKHAVEAANKMLLLGALENASEVVVDGPRLVVRFADSGTRQRAVVEKRKSKTLLEALASHITGRAVRLGVVTGDAPVERQDAGAGQASAPTAAPADRPAPDPRPPAPSAAPAEGPGVESDPMVRAVLDTFRGEIVSVEKPS